MQGDTEDYAKTGITVRPRLCKIAGLTSPSGEAQSMLWMHLQRCKVNAHL